MIDYREDPESNVIELTVDGRVSRDELDDVATRLEAAIAKHGSVRLLEHVQSFGGMDPSVYWEDLKFSLRHLRDFSRCAVVADQTWVEWITKSAAPFVKCDLRHFKPDQIEQARQWLRKDGQGAGGAAAES